MDISQQTIYIPSDLHYSLDHMWIREESSRVYIGITDIALRCLGHVVFIDLPEMGGILEKEISFGWIESDKAIVDIYSPLDGKVIFINEILKEKPEIMNKDPYSQGWICMFEPTAKCGLRQLLNADQYLDIVKEIR